MAENEKELVRFVPTLQYFVKTYAMGGPGNDQKALKTYMMFESQEKVRRLQSELHWVKNNQVDETVLKSCVGANRAGKYGSFSNWASLALMWISNK